MLQLKPAIGGVLRLAIFFAMSTIACASVVGLPHPIIPNGFGVNIHSTYLGPDELRCLEDAGFGFVRMDCPWQNVEKKLGVYDFRAYDALLGDLDKAGVRALLILDYGNPLYDSGLSPHANADREAYARFCEAAAARYRNRGVIWELWNEPNLSVFWKPAPNAEDYAALVKVTIHAMRIADPRATILVGATNCIPLDYINTMLKSGCLTNASGLSVHPYRSTNPETVENDYAKVRALVAQYTPAGQDVLPIVCSEWGYHTATTGISEQKQACYIVREYLTNLAACVDLTIFYDWKNDGPDPSNGEHRYGMLTQHLTPKPSFVAVRSLIRQLRGYRFCHRIATKDAQDYQLLFEGPDDLALVTWSTNPLTPDDQRMPTVRKIADSAPEYRPLKRAASIELSPEFPIARACPSVPISVRVRNTEGETAAVVLTNCGRQARCVVPPHNVKSITSDYFMNLDGVSPQRIDLTMKWNDIPVVSTAAPSALIAWPIDLAVAPRGIDLVASITNRSSHIFNGQIMHKPTSGRAIVDHRAIMVPPDTTRMVTFAGATRGFSHLRAISSSQMPASATINAKYIAMPHWIDESSAAGYTRYFHVNDKLLAPTKLDVFKSQDGLVCATVLRVPYTTGSGWNYYTVEPNLTEHIPDTAQALILWINGDGSRVTLHARYMDSSGQTFQVDAGCIDWTGWRAIKLPLDGQSSSCWGGAADGIVHGSRRWVALILLDGSSFTNHSYEIDLASPWYEMR
ncbi:MAG: cellulase family glycosylhydrolase [Capsulimonadaceae bacterium]|nr:cellulase family glycosylhydrolase [Capsulimonadaceae bacterium]